jgi:hypothetical protein
MKYYHPCNEVLHIIKHCLRKTFCLTFNIHPRNGTWATGPVDSPLALWRATCWHCSWCRQQEWRDQPVRQPVFWLHQDTEDSCGDIGDTSARPAGRVSVLGEENVSVGSPDSAAQLGAAPKEEWLRPKDRQWTLGQSWKAIIAYFNGQVVSPRLLYKLGMQSCYYNWPFRA